MGVVVQSAPGGGLIIFPCVDEGGEVHAGGILAVHECFGAVVGSPEVHDVFAVESGFGVEGHDARAGGDEHGDAAGALGGFAGAGEVVAGDVCGEDEGFGVGAGGDHGGGHAQGSGCAVAGFLGFEAAAVGGQVEQFVAEQGGGFGLVYAGFGGEEHQFDVFASGFFEEGEGGVGGDGDDVLVRGHHGHSFLTDADDKFVGVHTAFFGEGAQVQIVGRGVEGNQVNANFHGAARLGAGLVGTG